MLKGGYICRINEIDMEFDVYLRAFKPEDAHFINELRKNKDIEEKIGGPTKFVSLEREQKWVNDIIYNDDPRNGWLAVCEKGGNDDIIGYVTANDIDYRNGTCIGGGIKVISPTPGKFYGLQVLLLGLQLAFEEWRMVRFSVMVLEENTGSLRIMERAGFKREGLMRNYIYKNGYHRNCWLLSMTDQEYRETKAKYKI